MRRSGVAQSSMDMRRADAKMLDKAGKPVAEGREVGNAVVTIGNTTTASGAQGEASAGSHTNEQHSQREVSMSRKSPPGATKRKRSPPPLIRVVSGRSGIAEDNGNRPAPGAMMTSTETLKNSNRFTQRGQSIGNAVVVATNSEGQKVDLVDILIDRMKKFIPIMRGTKYEMPRMTANASYKQNGVQFWVCLVCNKKELEKFSRDMICCDICEDWYHTLCVGIIGSVPEEEPWFCKRCIFNLSQNPGKE